MKKKLAQPTRSFFTLKISWKSSPGWLQLVFHFGTENREEQLKNTLYVVYVLITSLFTKTTDICLNSFTVQLLFWFDDIAFRGPQQCYLYSAKTTCLHFSSFPLLTAWRLPHLAWSANETAFQHFSEFPMVVDKNNEEDQCSDVSTIVLRVIKALLKNFIQG